MIWSIEFLEEAEKDMKKLDHSAQIQVLKGIKKVRVNSGFSRKEAHEFYRSLGYNNEKEQIRFLKSL